MANSSLRAVAPGPATRFTAGRQSVQQRRGYNARMLKWLLTLVVALVVLTEFSPWLARRGLGRLPGDMTVRMRGRLYALPFTSTILLSLLLALVSHLV